MSLRELTMFSDASCSVCKASAAEGAVVDGKILCRPHAQQTIWHLAETRMWELVRYMGREASEELLDEIRTRRHDDTVVGYVRSNEA